MDQPGLQPTPDFGPPPMAPCPRPVSRPFLLIPACGLVGTMLAIAAYRPLDRTRFLWIVLILFFAVIVLVAHVQQKARRGGDVSSLFPMVYWIACLPAVLALALWLNGALDHSAPETHQEVVTRKYASRGRSGTSYYIEFTSWRENRTVENVNLKYRQWVQFRVDDSILIDLQRGALGIAWIGDVR